MSEEYRNTDEKVEALRKRENRLVENLISLADKMEDIDNSSRDKKIRNQLSKDYKVTSDALIETKKELNILLGHPELNK